MPDFILYKPYGYLSQFVNNQNKRKNKKLLGELYDFPEGCMSIGRLDEKSEGLLMITTDGVTSARVRSKKVEKEYWAEVDGIVDKNAITLLLTSVTISVDKEEFKCKAVAATIIEKPLEIEKRFVREERHGPTSWISITLNEGKFRQVRKMTAAVGLPTLRLVRYRIGEVTLAGLESGKVLQVKLTVNENKVTIE
jgi:23S rRNA pseudouridine2457 synthase